MRNYVVAFVLLAAAALALAASVSPVNEYLPPLEDTITLETTKNAESALLTEDGYQYKTLRRLKYRQRRDVSEISKEYLSPAEEKTTKPVAELKFLDAPVQEPEDSAVLGENGYEYKTVRRLKYRQRRDVSEVANEYIPPTEETKEAVAELKSVEEPEDSALLGENGYEYKAVRRLKYRQRRDVSEVASDYLPPAEETTEAVAELKSVQEPEDSAVLGENGYEYKAVRRLKYRQRRDVSEVANEYLPPVEETKEAVAELKSVDVSEVASEYLPPAEQTTEAVAELKSVQEPEDSAVLGENGYEYKTVRRLKYRQRRDVSELANEYIPPAEETKEAVAELKSVDVSEVASEYLPPAEQTTEAVAELKSVQEPEDSAVLGENGYEYKTVRRLKYRQRRDVSEVASDYLPPAEETTDAVAELKSVQEHEDSAVLGENGYEYKTVRRLKYRQRRDVSEVANEYLPPVEETTEAVADLKSVDVSKVANEYLSPVEEITEAVADLKSVDVSKVASEYLPPAEQTTAAVTELKSVQEPEDSAVLGENGYEYKTVRRLKYRQRRDVSELANEYIPPAEETKEAVAEFKSVEEPEESAVLGENGYEYKTVRRLKYRQRRDVSEVANEYLPPVEETTEAVAYLKSVDVSEVANEYLPPAEETKEAVAELKSVVEPEDSAVLRENGYEYKTVRRLKYRQRRDVSEVTNQYLSPSEETAEPVAELKSIEVVPENDTVLGNNGYEYKTVRLVKYRA